MLVRETKNAAREWVAEEASRSPGFAGAFFHGSVTSLPDDAKMPRTSDVDIIVVIDGPDRPPKLGKFGYLDVLLEVAYRPIDDFQSAESILGVHYMAGSFRFPSVISDPTGTLTALNTAVSREFAKRTWVYRRCESARNKVLDFTAVLKESDPLYEQVTACLFVTSVTTYILLMAGLRNPSVRRRYAVVRELLSEYGRLDIYETLLDVLGCARMSRVRAECHMSAVVEVFDFAKTVIQSPFFFGPDISDVARPVAIDGSRELLESGHHRDAVFWLAVTYSRCQRVLDYDAPVEAQERFTPGYLALLGDLGISSFADMGNRIEHVKDMLPKVWNVAEEIIAANPEIEDF